MCRSFFCLVPGSDEVDTFKRDTPISRLGVHLRARGLWDDAKETALQKVGNGGNFHAAIIAEQVTQTHTTVRIFTPLVLQEVKAEISKEFQAAEKRLKPPIDELFRDVYDEMPPRLKEQVGTLKNIL